MKESDFFRENPEGVIIVALDSRRDGFLFGAVELRWGEEAWLDYGLEFGSEDDMVSLYRCADDTPMLEYRVKERRVDTVTRPDRLLVLWNHGEQTLSVDGDPLSPDEIFTSVPQGITPWLFRFADWLPKQK